MSRAGDAREIIVSLARIVSLRMVGADSDSENKRGNHHADVQLLRQMWTGTISHEGFLLAV